VWDERADILRGQNILALRTDDSLWNACRLMSLPFAVGLGLIIFAWSCKLYGDTGGILSLLFFCFCPNFLAHAPLMTPDLTLSCLAVATVWRLWRLTGQPTRLNLLWAGIALGLMLLTKYTALLLVPNGWSRSAFRPTRSSEHALKFPTQTARTILSCESLCRM